MQSSQAELIIREIISTFVDNQNPEDYEDIVARKLLEKIPPIFRRNFLGRTVEQQLLALKNDMSGESLKRTVFDYYENDLSHSNAVQGLYEELLKQYRGLAQVV